MRTFQDTFKIWKRSFISTFSICMTVPLKHYYFIQWWTNWSFFVEKQWNEKYQIVVRNFLAIIGKGCQETTSSTTTAATTTTTTTKTEKITVMKITIILFLFSVYLTKTNITYMQIRGAFATQSTSKTEFFVKLVNGFQSLIISSSTGFWIGLWKINSK